LDGSETVVAEFRFAAARDQRDRVLSFAARFAPRTWAVEQATGLGALLAQQLVAVGETVFDVPPTLSARVRLLDSTRTTRRILTTHGPPQPVSHVGERLPLREGARPPSC
jgi:hypothetical protein